MVMKKAFLVLAILVGSAALTFAQPKSIGGRLGNYGIDVSYENYVSEARTSLSSASDWTMGSAQVHSMWMASITS